MFRTAINYFQSFVSQSFLVAIVLGSRALSHRKTKVKAKKSIHSWESVC